MNKTNLFLKINFFFFYISIFLPVVLQPALLSLQPSKPIVSSWTGVSLPRGSVCPLLFLVFREARDCNGCQAALTFTCLEFPAATVLLQRL